MKTTGADYTRGTKIKVRRMTGRDLSEIARVVRQTQAQPWRGWDFMAYARPMEMIGWVAEVGTCFAGFALCTPVRQAPTTQPSRFAVLRGFCRRLLGKPLPTAVYVNLLDVTVCGEGIRSRVERALLEQLDRGLGRLGDPIRVVVPETKLAAQLFLRKAGYLATRVLHDYFGNEDGYLMERSSSGPPEEVFPWKRVETAAKAPVETA